MDFETEIKKEFLMEARELVESCEELFLEFEQDVSNSAVIDSIFRIFHTIKGSSFTAGFDQLGEFTHKVENILSSIKAGTLEIDEALCDLLIRSNDTLSRWVGCLSQDIHYREESSGEIESEILTYADLQPVAVASLSSGFEVFDDERSPAPSTLQEKPKTEEPKSSSGESKLLNTDATVKILIVDDEDGILDLIEMYLEDFDFEIHKAADGKEGVKVYQDVHPDMVLSDFKMPHMDGLELLAAIRRNDTNTPFAFISGAASRDDIIKFVNLGCLGFIDKPIPRDALLGMVRNGVYLKKMKDHLTLISMLNFKIHMCCFQLTRAKDDVKRAKLEKQVKVLLDEVAELNNRIFTLKILEIA